MSINTESQDTSGNPEDPTSAEWKVLRCVWDRSPVAMRDVLTALEQETNWSASTVKTLLRRLVEKGHLETERVGNSFLYSTKRSPLGPLRRAADLLMERAGGERLGSVLAYLVNESRLTDKDLGDLRDLIDLKAPEDEA